MRRVMPIALTEGQIEGLRKLGDKFNIKVLVLLNRAVNEFLQKQGINPGPDAATFAEGEDEPEAAVVSGNEVRRNHSSNVSSKSYEDRYDVGNRDSQFARQNQPPRY